MENKFKVLNEKMNTELYVNILKEKRSEKFIRKGFVLMRDNALSHVCDRTAEYMKSTKMKDLKD